MFSSSSHNPVLIKLQIRAYKINQGIKTTEKVKNNPNHKLRLDDNPKQINRESYQKEDHPRIHPRSLLQKS